MDIAVLLLNLVSRPIALSISRGCGGESGDYAPYWDIFHLLQIPTAPTTQKTLKQILVKDAGRAVG